ncbi:unnamed protein product [Paramecium sonneborni]|uniref:Tetratricopeptide repeat protein n=1 Tax=Paramecium sonneborni TaxID=65129 RepID=A0A8S1QBH6_9CILI|nr:unnamed protein product [Paramecium sonneborni]
MMPRYNITSGLTLVLMGHLDEALENIEIAIQSQPENSLLFNNKAFI